MKPLIFSGILYLILISCTTPGPITANPDDATGTPGTTGSAKMTEQMPRRPVVDTIKRADTMQINRSQPLLRSQR